MKKKPKGRQKITPFRLDDGTIAALEKITAHMKQSLGVPVSKAAAVGKLIREAAEKLPK
jgi:hypothetical protein